MASSVLAKMAVLLTGNATQLFATLDKTNAKLSGFEKNIASVGKGLAGFLAADILVGGIGKAIGVMADFEVQMSTVRAITGATGKEFEALEKDALELGRSTKYTAIQVGELQVAYGRLGFTTKEILAATKATLDLAAATGEDLAKSADVAGSTVRGFALDASETQRVVDVMASSFNKSALGLENFTESMKYVAPIANAANVSVEETTALLAVLADSGIRGSQAGTSLRKIFGDLTKDGRPLQERLAELSAKGITLADSYDEVGRTAQTALLVLSKNTDKTGELTEAFKNASGEAAEMAHIMSDNLTGDVTKLSSAWEGLILSLGNTSALRSATQSLTELVNGLAGNEKDGVLRALALNLNSGSDSAIQMYINKLKELSEQGVDFSLSENQIEEFTKGMKNSTEVASRLREILGSLNTPLKQQSLITESATALLKDYGYDLTAITNALYDNKDAFEILAEVEKVHTAEVKASIEAEINRSRTVALTKEELKKLNDELERQSEIERSARIARLERSQAKAPLSLSGFTDLGKLEGGSATSAMAAAQRALADNTNEANKAQEKQISIIMMQREAWANLGSSIGDTVAQTIAAGAPLLQSLSKITASIINQLEQITLARMIANNAKFGIGGILLAAAGFGIVKGLFNKLGKDNSQGTFQNNSYGATNGAYGMSTVRVYQRGTDMQGTLDESSRLSKRTKG